MSRVKITFRHYVLLFLVVTIIYLVGSLYRSFEYLDFGYLIVIVIGLIRLLNVWLKD